jgi:predicted heme/steroid binding protein
MINNLPRNESFFRRRIKKIDGGNGITYVAVKGKVYDILRSYHWRRGVH